jgi:Holliday junction resolvasome RuvABC endonuclease subunit
MLLALDINTRRTGFAFGGETDGAPRVGHWKLYGCHEDVDLTRSAAALYNSISDLCKLIHPRFVILEAPFNPALNEGRSNHQSVMGLFSLAAIASAAGHNAGATVSRAHVQTWRKSFTGHGRPQNPKAVTQARCALLGWSVANEDEADAAGVWCWGMSMKYPKWAPRGTPLFADKGAV